MSTAAFGNTLSLQMPTGGAVPWWLSGGISAANCVAAYQPKGAASLAASYVNLANPGTYNAAPGVAPTFDAATGWTFNGFSQYLTTGIIPSFFSQITLAVRFSNASLSTNAVTPMGAYRNTTPEQQCLFVLRQTGSNSYWNNKAGFKLTTTGIPSGVLIVSDVAYKDGVAQGNLSGSYGLPNVDLYVGADHNISATGGRDLLFSGKIQAAAVYNTYIIGSQAAALSTAMAAL